MNNPNFRGDGFDNQRLKLAERKRKLRARNRRVSLVRQLKGQGLSFAEIAEKTKIHESSVRYYLSN